MQVRVQKWGQVKGYPFEVTIPSEPTLGGVVLADQVKSLDWRIRKAEFICKLPCETTSEVLDKLGALLLEGN
ncbi:MAG: type II toxin-antitoxin system PemK/MazF family toxin [Candidatus Binatia bacterium]